MAAAGTVWGAVFDFPTANRALLEPGGEARFFTGVEGKDWTTGQFGCVRSDGHRFHEGLDIRCLTRDRHGEPMDAVNASADGQVAYINRRPGLSNYGNYVVIWHLMDGIEIYTLYAHLAEPAPGLAVGQKVQAGQTIGRMGRTANTRQRITKERAHCHFEIDFGASDHFAEWFNHRTRGEQNDHGNFNGRNLLGIDPAPILRLSSRKDGSFNLARYVKSLPELCRVAVKGRPSWIRRCPGLVETSAAAARDGVAGYEIAITFNGAPIRAVGRSAQELPPGSETLLAVNPAVAGQHACCGLLARRGTGWALTSRGSELMELLGH